MEVGVRIHLQGVVYLRVRRERTEVGEEAHFDIFLEGVSCGLAFQMLGVEVLDSGYALAKSTMRIDTRPIACR
jgi:hypothetical protein